MNSKSITFEKSKAFAIRIVNLYKHITATEQEYVMTKQLLRCGTSIGANLAEARCGISTKDFLAKIYVALKECSETQYWLELLHETDYLKDSEFNSIYEDCTELFKLLTSTTKTISLKLSAKNSKI